MRSMRSGAENENEYDEFYYIRCRDTRSSSDSMEPQCLLLNFLFVSGQGWS